jgi:hypothetical protein
MMTSSLCKVWSLEDKNCLATVGAHDGYVAAAQVRADAITPWHCLWHHLVTVMASSFHGSDDAASSHGIDDVIIPQQCWYEHLTAATQTLADAALVVTGGADHTVLLHRLR